MLPHATGALIERCGRAYGPDIAVVYGDRRITYREQLARVRRAGRALLDLGLRRGDRIGVLMADRPELLEVYFGLLWAGLAVVPLNTMASAADLAFLLGDSGARAVVHDGQRADLVHRAGADVEFVLCVDPDGVLDGGHDLALLANRQPDGPGMPDVGPADRYGIFYTGGPEGRPKGAEHTHGTYLSAVTGMTLDAGLGERDRFAHVAPLTHAGGMFVLPTWLRGGTNVVLGGFDPDQLMRTAAAERITATMVVPTMLSLLLDHDNASALAALSTVVYSGSPLRPDRLDQALSTLGPALVHLYGQAEAPNQLTVLRKGDHARAVETGETGPLSSHGRAASVAEVRLVDEEGNDAGSGPGEVLVRGPHVVRAYWNRPEETEATLGGGWFHTGDVVRADERGFLSIVDRKRDLILSGGFPVYPEEVEAALRGHPAVREVAVVGLPDEKWGESVTAVVVADPATPVAAGELIAWVKERKGSLYAPKAVHFTPFIPLTATGKPDKPALRGSYSARG